VVEYFDAVEVCCETVVAYIEPEAYDCLFSGFIFVVSPCSFDVLPLGKVRKVTSYSHNITKNSEMNRRILSSRIKMCTSF
jgi:hypothetical protein